MVKRFLIKKRRWVLGLSLVLVVALIIIARGPDDVKRVPIGRQTHIAAYLPGNYYADCYRMLASKDVMTQPGGLEAIAFERGIEQIHRTERELVYRGTVVAGIDYYVSYRWQPVDTHTVAVEIATVVQTHNRSGRIYFFFVRPFHRIGLPWVIRHVARSVSLSKKPGDEARNGTPHTDG